MALDINLRIADSLNVNTGVGTSQASAAFDFGTALGTPHGDREPFPEGATLVCSVADGPEAGALPVRVDLELSLDGGANWRKVCSVTFTNAKREMKAARFGLLDWVPEATVLAGTDRAAAVNLQARVVANYTTAAGAFIFTAFLAGPQSYAPFVE